MPSPSHAATSGTYEEFTASYEADQAASWVSGEGQTLLHLALTNDEPAARVAIANRLLDDGADAAALLGREKYTTLHILFGRGTHDVPAEAPLLERLLDGGADVNRVVPGFGTPIQTLATQLKFDDEELEPFYDVLFARPDLDLLRAGKAGRSSLESARLLRERRTELTARIEAYLQQHGQATDES